MSKSNNPISAFLRGHASRPYNKIGRHLPFNELENRLQRLHCQSYRKCT